MLMPVGFHVILESAGVSRRRQEGYNLIFKESCGIDETSEQLISDEIHIWAYVARNILSGKIIVQNLVQGFD